jgi:Lon protease-like protein
MDELPLFPLATVLLPGERLPLTVFEPRYVDLLRSLMEREERERCFGVVAIRRGHEVGVDGVRDLHGFGCEARVDAIAAAVGLGEPRYQLIATGTRRFRLDRLLPAGETPWLRGQVSWLPPLAPAAGTDLARLRRAVAAFTDLVGTEPADLPDGAPDLAARVVGAVPTLGMADRLEVLTAETTTEQTEAMLRLLRREVALIRGLGAVRSFEPPAPSAN